MDTPEPGQFEQPGGVRYGRLEPGSTAAAILEAGIGDRADDRHGLAFHQLPDLPDPRPVEVTARKAVVEVRHRPDTGFGQGRSPFRADPLDSLD